MTHQCEEKKCEECDAPFCHVCWLKCPHCNEGITQNTDSDLIEKHENGKPHQNEECSCFAFTSKDKQEGK